MNTVRVAISWNFSKVKKEAKNLGFKILSKGYKNNSEKLQWKHIVCGHEFFASWVNIYNNKQGCASCNSSKGEKAISNYLNKVIGIENYFREYKIKNSIVSKMKFDFFIPSLKLIIEYDGIAHFKPIRFGGVSEEKAKENLKSQKKRDRIKNKFCKKENYNILRISYLEFDKIEILLEKKIKSLLY